MGSPITFSGFNSIDFNTILNAVMQQERTPLTALETRKTALETQNTTFGTFATKLSSLETAVKNLAKTDSLAKVSAASSDEGVGVSTTTSTVEGTYDVVVSQLARAQVTTSTSTYGSVDAVVGTGGALQLLAANQPPVEIMLTGSMTLKQIAEAINAKTESPVTASVVQAAPGSYRLVLTGRSTGTDNAFTLTSTMTGGLGLTFADGDTDGIFGEAGTNTQEARNAALTVNSLAITSSSNDVTDVVPGVTLKLKKEDATKTATITVTRDSGDVAKNLETFVKSYNDVITFLTDQNNAAATGKTSIARDPILRSLRDSLRSAMLEEYAEGGATYSRLATVGVEFEAGGKIKLNKEKLEDALADSPSNVQKLFAGATGTGGAFGAVQKLLKDYTEAGGLVASARTRLGEQVTSISKRLDTLEAQLAIRRTSLQQEYIAADLAMTQIKAQSSSLSALGSQYRLF
jgi:flagellar hook-associated protein 2